MGPKEIQALRHALGENSETFGKRFARSKRTVEDWEQGRRSPDPLVLSMMKKLERAKLPKAESGHKIKKSDERPVDTYHDRP